MLNTETPVAVKSYDLGVSQQSCPSTQADPITTSPREQVLGTAWGRSPGPHVQLATVPGARQPVGCSELREGKDEADGSWAGWWHHPHVGGRRRLLLVLSPPHQIRRCPGESGFGTGDEASSLSAVLASSRKVMDLLTLGTAPLTGWPKAFAYLSLSRLSLWES